MSATAGVLLWKLYSFLNTYKKRPNIGFLSCPEGGGGGGVLKIEIEGRGFQKLPRDLANVNVSENNV